MNTVPSRLGVGPDQIGGGEALAERSSSPSDERDDRDSSFSVLETRGMAEDNTPLRCVSSGVGYDAGIRLNGTATRTFTGLPLIVAGLNFHLAAAARQSLPSSASGDWAIKRSRALP